MPCPEPPSTIADPTEQLEWAGSELAGVEADGPGALTIRLSSARVWRQGVPGYWPGWRLRLDGATVQAHDGPLIGAIAEGQWSPADGTAQVRWAWRHSAPGMGLLTLRLQQGGRLVVQAASWSVQVPADCEWREDWHC